eukprot:TRINITY_DN11880_c0_g1_i8.p3 TRINITY_DN11880_c0_g1~~TRINITY_DN11880_c0_g1_i8.p3  ORF type:complete len:109 (-),score=3.80 TRINITY_DN11880_c0_g1_i8:3-329(-)
MRKEGDPVAPPTPYPTLAITTTPFGYVAPTAPAPTVYTTPVPTLFPTSQPTLWPTPFPSLSPTVIPTHLPSVYPTPFPTYEPCTDIVGWTNEFEMSVRTCKDYWLDQA